MPLVGELSFLLLLKQTGDERSRNSDHQLVYFYPSDTEDGVKEKQQGMCMAFITLVSTTHKNERCRIVKTTKTRYVFHQPSPGIWIVMRLNLWTMGGRDRLHDNAAPMCDEYLLNLLKRLYKLLTCMYISVPCLIKLKHMDSRKTSSLLLQEGLDERVRHYLMPSLKTASLRALCEAVDQTDYDFNVFITAGRILERLNLLELSGCKGLVLYKSELVTSQLGHQETLNIVESLPWLSARDAVLRKLFEEEGVSADPLVSSSNFAMPSESQLQATRLYIDNQCCDVMDYSDHTGFQLVVIMPVTTLALPDQLAINISELMQAEDLDITSSSSMPVDTLSPIEPSTTVVSVMSSGAVDEDEIPGMDLIFYILYRSLTNSYLSNLGQDTDGMCSQRLFEIYTSNIWSDGKDDGSAYFELIAAFNDVGWYAVRRSREFYLTVYNANNQSSIMDMQRISDRLMRDLTNYVTGL